VRVAAKVEVLLFININIKVLVFISITMLSEIHRFSNQNQTAGRGPSRARSPFFPYGLDAKTLQDI
jgi:hypothetical protein